MSIKLKNIKIYIAILGLTIFNTFCGSSEKARRHVSDSGHRNPDSDLVYHFKILDSAAAATPYDTIVLCCRGSIDFMEGVTKIEPSSPGSFVGRLYFTKRDLERWHEWYLKKQGK